MYKFRKTPLLTADELTDEYSEHFEDDENEADRFTDDYSEDFKD